LVRTAAVSRVPHCMIPFAPVLLFGSRTPDTRGDGPHTRCPRIYIASYFSLSTLHHLSRNIILSFTHFHMSEGHQQGSNEYSYRVITFQNTVPPMSHNQATMPRDRAVSSAYPVSLSCRVLTSGGCSRSILHREYPGMISSCLHRRPIRLTMNHTMRATHDTMGQFHR
jgi:hypothetical protein